MNKNILLLALICNVGLFGEGTLGSLTFHITNINDNTLCTSSTDVIVPSRAKSSTSDMPQLSTVTPHVVNQSSKLSHVMTSKYILVGAGVVLSYVTLISVLWWYQWKIFHTRSWGCWKEKIITKTLLQIDQQILLHELLDDIKKYYASSAIDHDPLISFIHHVEEECAQLKTFLAIRQHLETLKLSYIVPGQQQVIAQAHTKLDRLTYLKKLVMRCLHEYSHKATDA